MLGGLLVALFFVRASFFINAAKAAIKERDFVRARKHLKWGKRLASRNGTLEFLRARVARLEGRMSDLKTHLTRAHEWGVDVDTLKREEFLAQAQLGQLKQAQRELDKMLRDPRGDAEEICEAYVIGYTKLRLFVAAKNLLDNWMADFPDSPRPRYLKGVIQKDLQMWKEAEAAFREALAIDPAHYDSAFELGSVLLTRKKPDQALEFFILGQGSRDYANDSRVAEAHCLRLLDRHEEASVKLAKFLEEFPDDEAGSLEMSRLELDDNKYDPIVERLAKFADLQPPNTDMLLVYSQALRGMGRFAEAEKYANLVLEVNKQLMLANELAEKVTPKVESADVRCQIAKIHLKYGSKDEGMMWLMGAFEMNPKHRPTLEALVEFYQRRKDVENASRFRRQLDQLN